MINENPSNLAISKMLEEIASLLSQQHADAFRIKAYQRAANLIRQDEVSLADVVRMGNGKALEALPGIGQGISRLIIEYIKTGKSQLLLHLQGAVNPEDLFEDIPGIGVELANRIVKELDIHSLEELEMAAHDGSLDKIEGFGKQRVEAIQLILAGMLGGRNIRQQAEITSKSTELPTQPKVALLLKIDSIYREKAAAGELKMIAPRRFNPDEIAWLPILHIEKEGWSFTALFSNTLRAHELEKTNDWVIIYYEKEMLSGQVTVVTESSGPLREERVVRGRELDCNTYYTQKVKA